jgi:hypothetical protein
MSDPRNVFGCYLHPGREEHSFSSSLRAFLSSDELLLEEGMWVKQAPSGGIFSARNELTEKFLRSRAEWMWTVDADMGFHPDSLKELLRTAGRTKAPIVGALCFSWPIVSSDGVGGYLHRPQPTIYDHDGIGFRAVKDYPRGHLIRAGATGAAFLLIHRSVMEEVKEKHGEAWWTPVMDQNGDYLGEDLSFFLRANPDQDRLIIDTNVKTTHAKTIYVSEEYFDRWSAR